MGFEAQGCRIVLDSVTVAGGWVVQWWARTMTVQEADTGRASFAGPAWPGVLKTTALGDSPFVSPPGEVGKGALKVQAAAPRPALL